MHTLKLFIASLFFTTLCSFTLQAEDFADINAETQKVTTGEPQFATEEQNPDPWEGFNRKMYRFNDHLDKAFLKPTAKGYTRVIPEPIRMGVSNFFGNLADVGTAINNLLQGKPKQALSDTGRVLVNTTFGFGGLFDIATKMKLEKHYEDFGQTLAVWGVKDGPYLVLPFLGPSSIKDTTGTVVDISLHPSSYVKEDDIRYTLLAVWIIDKRAGLLEASDLLEMAALDPYSFQRDAYLQMRKVQADDGRDHAFEDF